MSALRVRRRVSPQGRDARGEAARTLAVTRARGEIPPRGSALVGLLAAVATAMFPTITILAGAGVLALVLAARMPGVLLAAYLLIPFYKGGLQAYSPIDITLVLAMLNAAQVVPVLRDRARRARASWGLGLWISLALLIVGGVLYAPDVDLALRDVIGWSVLVFVALTPAALRVGAEPRYVNQLVWTFLVIGGLIIALGLPKLSDGQRLEVLGANTIAVGRAALVVPVIVVAFVLQQRSVVLRAAGLALLPAGLVIGLASGSRGPLLALAALAALAGIRYAMGISRGGWRPPVLAIGALGAAIVIISFATAVIPDRSRDRFALFGEFLEASLAGDPPTADRSSETRVNLFRLGLDIFEDRPLLGAGPAGFEALSPLIIGPVEAAEYPHNALIQVASETGLAGLLVVIAIATIALFRALPGQPSSRAIRGLFAFFVLNAMVSGDIFSDRGTWGLLLVLLAIDAPVRLQSVATEGRECAACGRALSWAARFCSGCGSRLELAAAAADRPTGPRPCDHCGRTVTQGARFCRACGVPVDNDVGARTGRPGSRGEQRMPLRVALEQVLEEHPAGIPAADLTEEIRRLGLYRRKDGLPPKVQQVQAGVHRYPGMFVRDGGRVRLRRPSDG